MGESRASLATSGNAGNPLFWLGVALCMEPFSQKPHKPRPVAFTRTMVEQIKVCVEEWGTLKKAQTQVEHLQLPSARNPEIGPLGDLADG